MNSTQAQARLDPLAVAQSRYIDDNGADTYFSARFMRLKESIGHHGGNIVPIKVRPDAGEAGKYEVVFGHARLRACLEMGVPVLAVVEDLSEVQIVTQFLLHQSFKTKWQPWRLGAAINRSLSSGLFPSVRRAGGDRGDANLRMRVAGRS